MDEIFHMIRDGNAIGVRLWLDSLENDLNLGDDHGFTLLHWASWDGRLNIVEMLLNRGAKLNSTNKCDDTPLHCACQNNHLEVALFLIKNKANINATNVHGNTPLHYACHFNYIELAMELLKYGALLNLCNRYNKSALDLSRPPLNQILIDSAKSMDLNLNRIAFREDAIDRMSNNFKNRDITLLNQMEINIDELPVERMIDSNHGGTTWKGYWQGTEVVIKVLKVREATARIASSFNQEYKRLRIFNSAYILPVIGACVSLPDLIIVSQFMPHGSLFNYLHEQKDVPINFNRAIDMSCHIAKGMEFLHNLDPMIHNFQLNSKHVMICEDEMAKLNMADYKFSFTEKDRFYNPAWMAPEEFKKRPEELNKKACDMWSFAILLWELHTRQIPFGQYSPMQCGRLISTESLRVQLPSNMSPHIQKLIRICMNEDASKRPKFDMILPILEKFRNSSPS